MIRSIEDFAKQWQMERESTLKVLRTLTDESLSQRIPEGRSLGFLGWHITVTLSEMLERAGIHVGGPTKEPEVKTASEIVDAYEHYSAALLKEVRANWTDDVLDDMVEMYGEQWSKGTVLTVLVVHEAHHRGQMTVLMRLAGLKVPGVYGPAREDWATWGMEAPA